MLAQTKEWKEVSARFEALGEHLHTRFDETGADVAADRAAFEQALKQALCALEEAFGAAGKLVRDAGLHKDLNALTMAVRSALAATADRASEQVRTHVTTPVRRVLPGKPAVAPPRAAKPAARKPAQTRPAAKPAPHRPVVRKPAARKGTTA